MALARWFGLLLLTATVQAFPLVADGQPQATIVVPAGSPEARTATAKLLQGYVQQSTGVVLSIADKPGPGANLLLGRSPAVDALGLKLEALDGDGFVLKGVDAKTYVVAGPTEWGTEFGVDELLERYVGVRWLLPGPNGTDVPKHTRLELPAIEVRLQPAFFSRLLSGLPGGVQQEWARRNRMHGRVSFHHNLLNLFPPSKYTATHPEFFPTYGGQRYLPAKDDDSSWQPNLAAAGIVDEAIRNIKEFFRTHPGETSYSLGMNDSARWDETPESLARETNRKNFLALRDVSDSYYRWCNEVVEGVLKEFPDKWFGLLAYNNVAEPPQQVKLNPRIIPYMTYDRMKWVKPELQAQGHALTERWQAMSPTLGWYDYTYGSPYCLPRFYPHQMASYLRYGYAHGVRAHYAEIYENWGEGPKAYVFLRLQWDPSTDVDKLLDEWYQRAVGPAAAPALRQYYAIWERWWTQRAPQSKWWTDAGQYLNFGSPLYLADVDPADIRRSRALMDEVLAKAATADQRARAALLRDAFAYYEASALAYQGDTRATAAVATEAEALAAIEQAVQKIAMGERRIALVERFAKDPVLAQPLDFGRLPQLRGDAWGAGQFWQAFDWLGRSQAVRDKVASLAEGGEGSIREHARTMLIVKDHKGELLSVNPSAEEGTKGWTPWVQKVGTITATAEQACTGKQSILLDGLDRGGPHQMIAVHPGRYVAFARAYIPAGQQSTGTVELATTMRGDDDKNLPSPSTLLTPVPGRWITLVTPLTVPEKVGETKVTKVLLVPIANGFRPGEKLYLDDIEFYRLPDTP